MEAGSVDVYKGEREKKYDIYVEEYVLSYLKREADSLELSEIYFFGKREDGGRKIYVYGAGRGKKIAVFAEYEPLTELMCRLTQAGPVFMVRGADGSCKATGFQVFYENNEAMQSFLIEWTGSEDKGRKEEKNAEQATALFPVAAGETKKQTAHGAISAQLCLILAVLVAIVISSTDSYDKMERLGQSAKEVFFAIENQESGETAEDLGEQTEIVVERNVTDEENEKADSAFSGAAGQREDGFSDAEAPDADAAGKEEEPEEGVLEPRTEDDGQSLAVEEASEKEETVKTEGAAGQTLEEEGSGRAEEIGKTEGAAGQTSEEEGSGRAEEIGKAEAVGQISEEKASGKDDGTAETGQSSTVEKASGKAEETAEKEDASGDSAEEQEKKEEKEKTEDTQADEENTEAFSRSITRYYEVKQGDTLYTISREIYGDFSGVKKICEVNQISDPDKIRSGQKIILP